MKYKYSRPIPLALLIALLTTFFPVMYVYAAHSITSVSPAQIVNDVDTTMTITGANFDSTAEVSLGGYGSLLRLTQSATEITALVPAGVPAGSYTVTVSMGVDVATCASPCITILNPTPTSPPVPTATTAALPFSRPQFVVRNSRATSAVQKGQEFTLKVVLENMGQATAYGSQAVFASSDLVPTKTGGVAAIGVVAYDDEVGVNQTFILTGDTIGKTVIVVDMTVTYYDDKGTSYSDKFTLSVPVSGGAASSGVVYPTATPTGIKSSQLVITNYSASVDPLQPGEQFGLKMTVQNVGNVKAQRITMIVGGGSSGSGGGTPQPGGVSGGGGDFANFAPVGASNVQSLGDLGVGEMIQAAQNLIVNVNTNPGAYPMRISFSYLNDKSEVINDEQVITLLVYSLPNLDVSFYRPPDPFMVGQPGALPLQVVNLGRRLAVLGNMKVSARNGLLENGTSLIGSLDAGGYFTLDSIFTAEQSGEQSLEITIEYVDDFNQPRTLTKTLEIDVMEGLTEPVLDPSMVGGGGEFPVIGEETIWQKIWRFVLGVFGLDSSAPSGGGGGGGGPESPQLEERPVLPPSGKGG